MSDGKDLAHNLMINYIPRSLSADEFRKIFEQIGDIQNCRLMTQKPTGESMGYGFVTYANPADADLAIEKLHGMHLHGKQLKVAFAKNKDGTDANVRRRPAGPSGGASGGGGGDSDANVYIAGLPNDTQEADLQRMFGQYGQINQSKVLPNPKGDGPRIAFVRFANMSDANVAINEMHGKSVDGSPKPLVVKLALKGQKDNQGQQGRGSDRYNPIQNNSNNAITALQMNSNMPMKTLPPIPSQILVALAQAGISCPHSSGHSNIVTGEVYSLYVYGLPNDANETTLYELFCPFGGILNVRPIFDLQKEGKPCKGFGFVNFRKYIDACQALVAMDGFIYEQKQLRVSFKDDKNNQGPPPGTVNQLGGLIQGQVIQQPQIIQQAATIQTQQYGQQIATLGQGYQQNDLQYNGSRGGIGGRGIQPMKY